MAGYLYDKAPGKVGPLDVTGPIDVVVDERGQRLDVTEVVARHLALGPVEAAGPGIRLTRPLPGPVHGNPEIQPLAGVPGESGLED